MRKHLLYIVLITSINLAAQGPQGSSNDQAGSGIVKGTVKDNKGENVEYATITIFTVKDSSLVTGAISGEDGRFEINGLANGSYYANVSYVGFDNTKIDQIDIQANKKMYDLGEIKILANAKSINEVEIMANRPQVEYRLDKKIVSVSQDITAAGGTAVDVLENVPSIQTDIEGNVSLRGSSSFTVYIDGRPSILGSEILQQLPASAIENIEIITNPSAKYDAEGTAGIINVIMKKRKGQGVNGIVNASLGSNNKYGIDALVNVRAEQFNISGGINYDNRNYSMENNMWEREWEDNSTDTLYTTNNRKNDNLREGLGFKLGIDYYLNDNNTLTVSGEYDIRGRDRISEGKREELFLDTKTTFYTKSFSYSNSDNYELNLDYVSKFNNEGHELTARFNYEGETGGRNEGVEEYVINGSEKEITNHYNVIDDNPEFELRFKVDYVNPFSEYGKLEAGLQYDADFSHYNYRFQNFVEDIGYQDVDSLSQILDINRSVYGAYTMFSNRLFKSLDYQLGLRMEYTDRIVKADKDYPIKRPDIFPSVHVSQMINEKNQLMVNYSRRIRRPREWTLNPILRYWDSETARQGNPELEPEYSNSYEFNYQRLFGKSYVALELYHRKNMNLIEQNIERRSDGTKLMTDLNVGESFATGTEIMSNLMVKSLLVVNASYSIYNYKLNSPIRNEELDNETFAWRSRLTATVNLPWKGRLQLSGFYNSSSITSQGERDGYFVTNFGYRQDFFDRKVTATLQGRDLFGSMNFNSISYLDNAIIKSDFKRESPIVSLTLSYKINNYKTRERNNEGGGLNGGGMDGGGDDMF